MDKKKKILIVDDDTDLSQLLKFRLESVGYSIATAHTGKECIAVIEAFAPDAVILDVDMPEKNGLATFLELKNILTPINQTGRKIFPVIVSSGITSDAIKGLFESEGAFQYFTKPLDSQILVRCLERLAGHVEVAEESIDGKNKDLID